MGQRQWRCCWFGAYLLGPTSVLEGSFSESYGNGDAGWALFSLLGASFSPLALSSKGESPVFSGREMVALLASLSSSHLDFHRGFDVSFGGFLFAPWRLVVAWRRVLPCEVGAAAFETWLGNNDTL